MPPFPPVSAAGAVVWRLREGELEVLLVHRPRYNDWSWPKGKVEPGEDIAVCAVREVQEETGRRVILGRPLRPMVYRLASGRVKLVHYWTARLANDDDIPALAARAPIGSVRPGEVDAVKWFGVVAARRRLSRLSDCGPLDQVVKYHQANRLATRTVVIVRHARAVPRAEWSDGEATRPLCPAGRERSRRLTGLLAAYGVVQLIASPWARCVATVRPYARRSRLRIVTSRWLTEDGAKARPGRAQRLVERILAGGLTAVAICTHRPVLPVILDQVRRISRASARRELPAADPYLKTAACLVAHVAPGQAGERGKVVAIEVQRPLA